MRRKYLNLTRSSNKVKWKLKGPEVNFSKVLKVNFFRTPPSLMKNKVSHFLLVALLSSYAHGQRGLTKIPDTSIQAQLDAFVLPEGAKINLFASEPVVRNPIHMNWDSQGRLWVVGSPLYPHIKPGQEENDQVVVLEDTDGDGVADESVVFADNLHIPTGVLPGDGGVYVANSNDVLFLADTNDDGKADHREVVLSGFGTEDTHHIVHTFRWGPEGMMWLNQSIYIHTHLDTPYGIRRLLGGGMWHYRPETRRSEVFMKGLVNPWGHVFDKWGQSFMTDGAGGQGINFVYPRAVFVASPGAPRRVQGLNPGQPKLCGLEVLSGTHIPEHWRGALASPDFRGHRIKTYRLSDKGAHLNRGSIRSYSHPSMELSVRLTLKWDLTEQSMWQIYTIRSSSMVKWIFVIPDVITSMDESGGSVFRRIPRRLLPSLQK